MGVTSLQGFAVLVENDNRAWSLCKLLYIVTQTYYTAWQCRYVGRSIELSLPVRSRTEVNAFLYQLSGCMIPLQLSSPESTEVAVYLAVVILEHTRVDGERATHGLLLGDERTFRTVGNSYTQVEHTIIVLGREDEVVLAVLLYTVVVPHLFLCPFHLLYIEDDTMVCDIALFQVFERQHMVVFHLEVSSVIVEGMSSLTVVAGVDIQLAVKHIG